MNIYFCGYNENSTIAEIRKDFSEEEKCERILKEYRVAGKKGVTGPFDAVAALILGGAAVSSVYQKNFIKYSYNKKNNDATTWDQAAIKYFADRVTWNGLLSKIKETNTLKNIYDLVKGSNALDEERKRIVLNVLMRDNNAENNSKRDGHMESLKIDDIVTGAIEKNKQVIFTGAPGTGKTYAVRKYVKAQCTCVDGEGNEIVDKNQYKFVQFHPSYDYSDFVEGLRPVVIQGQTESTFVRMDGVFKEFCRHIVEESKKVYVPKKYFFIVDEINRADLAKVFGELMFGLEESYRGEDNPIATQYKNLTTYRILEEGPDAGKAVPMEMDVFEKGFYIPENLYFIGTMNDIDRSVDSMDFALRRRFMWVDIKANEIMQTSLEGILGNKNIDASGNSIIDIEELADKIIKMNDEISNSKFGLTDAYHIGPAYFKKLDVTDYENSLETIFEHNIVSILKEYTRGRKQEEVENLITSCRNALLGEN